MVVDDHRKIRDPLAVYLRRHGFDVRTAPDAAAMHMLLRHERFDVIVLDVMLPDGDGFDLCRQIHAEHDSLVILLTALGESEERVRGLELGADDYVVKPFDPRELVARIQSVLRRRSRTLAQGAAMPPVAVEEIPAQPPVRRYGFAGWVFDVDLGRLTRPSGAPVALSEVECRLLLALLQHPNTVLSRERLLDLTEGERSGEPAFDRTIDRQVSRLRLKLSDDARQSELLRTVWGNGYRLVADVKVLA
ncbi:response regulator [Pigmentiphaga aceris]|uniref:Response regulator n=2 Tax=Pigmentiphaga aceris TaxID=1940612 RepID=A0A5C0B6K3_9BURK|nr:response regulator [Pigmentiphaga aceris]